MITSAVLHLLVLWAFAAQRTAAVYAPPPAVEVELIVPWITTYRQPQAAPEKDVARRETPDAPASKAPTAVQRTAAPSPIVGAVRATPPTEPSRPAFTSSVEPFVVAGPAPSPPAPAPQPAADALDDYRERVWDHLASRPPAAPPGAGVAKIAFGLDENGRVLFVKLARSSGQPKFDRACLASVRQAGPFPAPPPTLDRSQLVFEAPIRAPR